MPCPTMTLVQSLVGNQRVVSVLAMLFGISSWIEVNGLWVELPLLISRLPDASLLASYIVILTQAANLGPLLYTLARYKWKDKMPDTVLIHCTMLVGTTASVLLVFLWDRTSWVGGREHSTSFLTLTFFLATVDCTSSVLYLPFVGRLRKEHLLPFLIGEGLSGLLPGLLALAQGVGGNPTCVTNWDNSTNGTLVNSTVPVYPKPRFSIEVFFAFLVIMLLVSWGSFLVLTLMPATLADKNEGNEVVSNTATEGPASRPSGDHSPVPDMLSSSTSLMQEPVTNPVSAHELKILLFLQGLICCLTNGFLPALQTFSCQPYGTVAFHLAVTLSSLSNPLACLLALRWWSGRPAALTSLTSIGCLSASYLIATAVLSPHPPMVGTRTGEAILVLSWVLFTGSLSYARACLASHLRVSAPGRALFYLGVSTQVGSFAGAVASFSLVNFTKFFVYQGPCT